MTRGFFRPTFLDSQSATNRSWWFQISCVVSLQIRARLQFFVWKSTLFVYLTFQRDRKRTHGTAREDEILTSERPRQDLKDHSDHFGSRKWSNSKKRFIFLNARCNKYLRLRSRYDRCFLWHVYLGNFYNKHPRRGQLNVWESENWSIDLRVVNINIDLTRTNLKCWHPITFRSHQRRSLYSKETYVSLQLRCVGVYERKGWGLVLVNLNVLFGSIVVSKQAVTFNR